MSLVNWLRLLGLSTLWGMSFMFMEIAIASFSPVSLVATRVGVAAALMYLLLAWRGRAGGARKALGAPLAALAARARIYGFLGLVNAAFPFFCFAWGQQYIDSGMASVLNSLVPMFAFVFACLLGREGFSALRGGGLALGIFGVAILIDPQAKNAEFLGMAAGVVAAVAYAVGGTFAWSKARHFVPEENALGQLFFAFVVLLPFALAERPWQGEFLPSALAAALGLAVLSTFGAYLLYFRLLASAGAVNATLCVLIIPVVAITLGAVVLDEQIKASFVLGSALVLVGLLFTDEKLRRLLWRLLARRA